MFTNWLTGTTNSFTLNKHNNTDNVASTSAGATLGSAGAQQNPLSSTPAGLMSTPPDVVLEVGPSHSATVRFVAHSVVLGMHSGYLRSAIRLDEHVMSAHPCGELVLYLGNVSAEQFAPLLTYMYTGYLDLNVENIFGVLLATHVLHMPRALEICRSFLARAQTEGYLANGLAGASNAPPPAFASNAKVIRPIPSKATAPNFGFLASSSIAPQLPLNTHGSYKDSTATNTTSTATFGSSNAEEQTRDSQSESRDEIDVDHHSNKNEHEDTEDEEVFIDSNSDTDNEAVVEVGGPPSASLKQETKYTPRQAEQTVVEKLQTVEKPKKPPAPKTQLLRAQRPTQLKNMPKSTTRKQSRQKSSAASASGLQVAKAPIPASQLVDASEGSKVIIDVASCDGPVRFRRILNTAYGHKPEDYAVMPERTQQSVSFSFHQQMAKTISQQRQLQHTTEESENSESNGSGCGSSGGKGAAKVGSNEIYVCVYCKHTFKSQYCYQKHAKRHLNPLSLSCTGASAEASTSTTSTSDGDKLVSFGRPQALPITLVANKQHASELLRREVRPLDMNVQYYPCKTCGSKFPSYYFVHKHRKMCHADEDANETPQRSGAARGSNESLAAEEDSSSTNTAKKNT